MLLLHLLTPFQHDSLEAEATKAQERIADLNKQKKAFEEERDNLDLATVRSEVEAHPEWYVVRVSHLLFDLLSERVQKDAKNDSSLLSLFEVLKEFFFGRQVLTNAGK